MGAGVRFARAFRAFSAAGSAATLLIAAAPAQAHRLKLRPLNPNAIASVRLFHPQARDRVRSAPVRASAAKRLEAHAAETRFRTQDGYEIPVAVSSSYTPDPGVEQGYVNLLGSFMHGTELGKISIYIATPRQIQSAFCGQGALACYVGDDERMYVPGVSENSDPPVQFLIAHEYGHHIELNRSNTPWSAFDQGAKHWATYENVCALERRHKVRTNYYNDPSEAFAESYGDMQVPGVDFIYTDLLKPDQGAFEAIKQDVENPWHPPAPVALQGTFHARGTSKHTFRLKTPLDGDASFDVSGPAGSSYRLRVRAGGRLLDRRSIHPAGTANYTICGTRSITLQVVRVAGSGPFTVTAQLP